MTENKIVKHILLVKISPQKTAEQFEAFICAFRELTKKIDGILSFEYGRNNSPEGLDRGMTHVITLTFVDAAARDAYLPHPEHVQFGRYLGETSILEDIIVADYTPQE
jgi:hypothetical protein